MSNQENPQPETKENLEKKKKEEDPLKKFKVENKYDPYILKNSLDECIKEILKEKYKAKESHKYEDTKIILGIIICLIVATSHYYPLPFPENYNIIIVCIIYYAVLSLIYTFYETKIEKDCFVLFEIEKKSLRFSSKIPLCNEFYHINLADANFKIEIKRKESVGFYFDNKGNISYERVEKLVQDMLKDFLKSA